MKLYIAALAVVLALPGTALAEDFTAEYTWGDPVMTGGIGPDGNWARAGQIEGSYVANLEDGREVTGSARCVGMDIDDMGFDLRMSCDMHGADVHFSSALLCVWRGDPGPETPLSCVGFMTGKAGELEGRGGMVSMNWHARGQAHAVGQWWPQAE